MKLISRIRKAPPLHWVGDGFPVRSVISPGESGSTSPFLLIDYAAPHFFTPSERPRGVGEHPHRGFETVTIAWQGEVDHRDSAGNAGTIGPGDVQWMTAASGVVHEEFHGRNLTRNGGTFEMAQIWVNLPAKHKMSKPGYQAITRDRIPTLDLPGGASARVIAGLLDGARGPARTFTPLNLWDVTLPVGGRASFPVPDGHTTILLVRSGRIRVNGAEEAGDQDTVFFAEDGDDGILLETAGGARALLLSGEPISEPVVAHGPFVMNTREEISRAILDYQQGRMGRLA